MSVTSLIPPTDQERAREWIRRLRKVPTNGGLRLDRAAADDLIDFLAHVTRQGVPAESMVVERNRDPWLYEAAEIYREHIGMLAFGRIGKALKPLVTKHGWDTVKQWWAVYCRDKPLMKRNGVIWGDDVGDGPHNQPARDVRFVTPEDFARTSTIWQAACKR